MRTQSQLHRLQEVPIQKLFIGSRLGVFMGLGKLSCYRKVSGWSFWNQRSLLVCCDWLGTEIICYRLTGCLGQCNLLSVSFYAPVVFALLPYLTQHSSEAGPIIITALQMKKFCWQISLSHSSVSHRQNKTKTTSRWIQCFIEIWMIASTSLAEKIN